MEKSIFDKWNKTVDQESLAKEVAEVAENGGGDYEEVPFGDYTVKVDKLEIRESRKGDPMLSAWFKILEGDHKGQLIFMNQVLTKPYTIVKANEFLESLNSEVEFKFDGNYEHYNNTILDIAEAIEGLEYLLDYGENSKGYSTFKIEEVYES